jgi:hypothetical protein
MMEKFRAYSAEGKVVSEFEADYVMRVIPEREVPIGRTSSVDRKMRLRKWLARKTKNIELTADQLARDAKTEGMYSPGTAHYDIVRSINKYIEEMES